MLLSFVCSCCCPRSALWSFKTPKYRKSEFWTTKAPKWRRLVFRTTEVPKFWIPEMPYVGISNLRSRQQINFCFCLYKKASEFQSSSVYYWSSLEEHLYYTQPIIRNKAYYRLHYLQHLVLSYKEHVQALVSFKPTNISHWWRRWDFRIASCQGEQDSSRGSSSWSTEDANPYCWGVGYIPPRIVEGQVRRRLATVTASSPRISEEKGMWSNSFDSLKMWPPSLNGQPGCASFNFWPVWQAGPRVSLLGPMKPTSCGPSGPGWVWHRGSFRSLAVNEEGSEDTSGRPRKRGETPGSGCLQTRHWRGQEAPRL